MGGKTLTKSLQASSSGFYQILAKSPGLMNLFCPGYRQYEHDLEFLLSILYIYKKNHMHSGTISIQLVKIAEIQNKPVNLKYIALQLCTCTWIEVMTGAGITLYMVYLGNYALAAITVAVFAPLIGFHFAVSKIQHSNVEWRSTRTVKSQH